VHAVLESLAPPDVYDPVAHVLQLDACAPLYLLSPHAAHVVLPGTANLPAGHGDTTLDPSQADPPGHVEHEFRFLRLPPHV